MIPAMRTPAGYAALPQPTPVAAQRTGGGLAQPTRQASNTPLSRDNQWSPAMRIPTFLLPARPRHLAAVLFALTLAGCATDAGRDRPVRTHDTLVHMQLEKQPQGGDCAVAIRITNRMRDINWDAVSYQVALLDHKNTTRGRLAGAPRRYTRHGQFLEDGGKVYGTHCEELVSASVIYFGYYPPGKRQTTVHLGNVKVELR